MPERTCVVCRAKRGKDEVFRFVRMSDGGLILDALQCRDGRGAYCCRTARCLGAREFVGKMRRSLQQKAAGASRKKGRGRLDSDRSESSTVVQQEPKNRAPEDGSSLLRSAVKTLEQQANAPHPLLLEMNKLIEQLGASIEAPNVQRKGTSRIRL